VTVCLTPLDTQRAANLPISLTPMILGESTWCRVWSYVCQVSLAAQLATDDWDGSSAQLISELTSRVICDEVTAALALAAGSTQSREHSRKVESPKPGIASTLIDLLRLLHASGGVLIQADSTQLSIPELVADIAA